MSKRIIAPPRLLSITTGAALLLMSGAAASAQELPTYEVNGFPITPFQLSILDTTHVQEQAANTTLTMDGMPASPNQIAVLGGAVALIGIEGDVVSNATTNRLTLETLKVVERLHKVVSPPEVHPVGFIFR